MLRRFCNFPGCSKRVLKGYCDQHQRMIEVKRGESRNHRNTHQHLYTYRWKKQSKLYLKKHPVCVLCGGKATELDHKIPHKGNKEIFWDSSNWQPLCKRCHSRKTCAEDGGFGNRKGLLWRCRR